MTLTTLDLSRFHTSNVTTMSNMFYSCRSLTTIYVGQNWSTENVSESSNMFALCNSLVGQNGTSYVSSNVDATFACVDKAIYDNGEYVSGDMGYLTLKDN